MRKLAASIFLTLILIISSRAVQQNQDDVIRVETDLVLVNATVTDGEGRFVPNLKREDFLLKEDGAKQQIAHFAAEKTPFAAAILIDSSASMATKLPRARVAASQFIEHMREGDSAAVYGFNTVVEQLQEFSGLRDISPDVWDMEAKGYTRLYDCLYEALDALAKRSEQRRAIILISDGADTTSNRRDSQVLELALSTGATIYAVDIAGDDIATSNNSSAIKAAGALKSFTDKTGGQYIKSVGGRQLDQRLLDISKELRSQYTLGFYPNKKKGRHKLNLEIPTRQGLKIRARQEYGGK